MKPQEIHVPLCNSCALETGSIFKYLTAEEVEASKF